MIIEIPGIPIARKAHERSGRFGKMRQFDPQARDLEEVRKFVRYKANSLGIDENTLKSFSDRSIEIRAVFGLPIPRSFNTVKLNSILWGWTDQISKPDTDNMCKFYLDCMKGILFSDDAQINFLNAKKVYSQNPSTVINIKIKDKMPLDEPTKAILSLINPQDFLELADEINELSIHVGTASQDPFHENEDLLSENRKLVAKILSKIADKHSKTLNTITKKFPGYWHV